LKTGRGFPVLRRPARVLRCVLGRMTNCQPEQFAGRSATADGFHSPSKDWEGVP